MVARGDLSVEIPMQEVPMLQKKFIKKCLSQAKQVIVATQMLESMVNNPRPTRAEVSDIANAVLDGTSAIMLSGETASGKYPAECVATMSTVAEQIENEMEHWQILNQKTRANDLKGISTDLIIGHSLCEIAMQVEAPVIFSLSAHGNTPKSIASYRPNCDIIALTPNEKTARQMNLIWGVTPILVYQDYADKMISYGMKTAVNLGYAKPRDLAVIGGSDTYDQHNSSEFTAYKSIGGICVI